MVLAVSAQDRVQDQGQAMSRISVLVADDNEPLRQLLTAALREQFVVHKPVANGRQLVETAILRKPDVIVTDVHMPVLGGVEAMQVLRQMGHRTPFVMVSADTEIGADCLQAGAAAFVCKVDIERDLVAAVMRAFEGRTCIPVHGVRRERSHVLQKLD